ncbi:hypothetical protein [Streptomyces thermolilacinus]|uniref:Uncharacterized protein n=1 Tax=Streptomyces thermolilacinus SPC6 TaxID=1306406 RepID=A0A1D3DLM5_9ACTN|nr:hypothetical protein [Streptomyces thermolilacinus]OEJ93224.1 hypothetical protein J116_000700 [Streptomyces thermolilacinus SPC6]
MSRTALLAPVLRALAAAAAAVSLARGRVWMGALWLLPTGLTSSLALYQARRGRRAGGAPTVAGTAACATGGACGGCARKVCS